jgi:hypothetical protein
MTSQRAHMVPREQARLSAVSEAPPGRRPQARAHPRMVVLAREGVVPGVSGGRET